MSLGALVAGCGSGGEGSKGDASAQLPGPNAPAASDGPSASGGDSSGTSEGGAAGEGDDGPSPANGGAGEGPGEDPGGTGGTAPTESPTMPSGGASGATAGGAAGQGTGAAGDGAGAAAGRSGEGGSDGMAPDVPVSATSGCSPDASAPEGRQSLDVDGTERSYIVSLPDDYDPETPYPLVFAWHGLGGSAELVSGRFYFGLEVPEGKPTIFVYPDGLDTGMGTGWSNTDGQDVAFFDELLATLEENYCVDRARVFSTGHSFGGMMTHTLACERAEVLRAVAPVAGAFFGFGGGDCTGPVAAWGAHGNPDNTVSYESGLSAIERVMETNGCDPNSGTPVEPTENCTLYECDAGYPVTWCVHDQDHDWPSFAAESIRAFFDTF